MLLSALPFDGPNLERLVAAAVVQSRQSIDELSQAVTLGRTDWRDLLVNAGELAHTEWRTALDGLLGA